MKKNDFWKIVLMGLWVVAAMGCEEKLPQGFIGSGTLEATEVRISAMTLGTILELSKDEGDTVAEKDLLARIDVEKLELQRNQIQAGFKEIDATKIAADAAIAQAKDHYENIRVKYARTKALYGKGSATQQQFDDIATQLDLARSQLTSAEAQKPVLEAKRQQLEASLTVLNRQIEDGRVLSPMNGMITEKYAERGELAAPGSGLYKIADLNHFWIKIYLAEPDLSRVTLGGGVKVKVDAVESPLDGKVAWVSPEAEFTPKNVQTKKARAELVYAVKITLDTVRPELKIGMPAEVYAPDTP